MGHGEADVKGGLAEVDDLVIQQHELVLVHEDVFGAVITVNESAAGGAGLVDKVVEKVLRARLMLGGVEVVGLNAERFEEGAILEFLGEAVALLEGVAMDLGEDPGELADVMGLEITCEQHRLPILVGVADGLHGEEMVMRIFEHQRGDGAGGGKVGEKAKAHCFALHPSRIGEPVDLDAEFRQRLLEDPAFAGSAADPDGAVGDAAGENLYVDLLIRRDAAGVAEIPFQLGFPFDV